MSGRTEKRGRHNEALRRFKLPPGPFKQLDIENTSHRPEWMSRAFQNNRYTVMIDDNCPTTKGTAIRAMVQRHDDKPIPNHWSEMMKIKNEIFGSEAIGIEYYPKSSDLVNQHNIYWLWIFPEGVLPVAL